MQRITITSCFVIVRLLALVDLYQKAYVLRNKQGGLLSALQLLQNFLQHLLPEDKK